MPSDPEDHPAPRLPSITLKALAILVAIVAILIAFASFLSTSPGRRLAHHVKWEVIPAIFPQVLPYDVRRALENAKTMQVYALDPFIEGEFMDSDGFHAYTIKGEATLTAPKDLERLVSGLNAGVKAGRMSMACFNPRHGVRVVDGATTHDFLICFQCFSIQVVSHGDKTQRAHFSFDGDCQAICDLFPADPATSSP